MLKNYYLLTKPGIIYGNALTAAAGFFLASKGVVNFWLFLATLLGLSLIIGSACVFNNYFDRDFDKKMARTKKRALAIGLIPIRNAIIFAIGLGLIGVLILGLYTNFLTLFIALLGFFFYVILYTFGKRYTVYGTEIGSISGAVPPVVGYTAVTDRVDLGALLLFLILVFWQMPHFYAIAIRREDDYKAAKIPVFPIKRGIFTTQIHMLLYINAFIIASILLAAFGFAGYTYLAVITLLGLFWLVLWLKGLSTTNVKLWARKMFFLSLVILTIFSVVLSFNILLP